MAIADHQTDNRHFEFEAGFDRPGDRFRLAAFLRADAGIGARGIDESDDRQTETVGQIHQALGLAISFRTRHPEIVFHAGFRVVTFFLAEHDDGTAVEASHAADHRVVFRVGAVAGQRREIGDQGVHIVQAMRPVRMAGDLHFLPGGQFSVGLRQLFVDAGLQPFDLVNDADFAVVAEMTQLLDLAFQLGDRFFEIEECSNACFCHCYIRIPARG